MASQDVLATQITIGTIGSGLLAYLKSAKWAPWFNKHSATINHLYLLASSAAGALGVHAVWDASSHSLTITGLSLVTIAYGFWEWAKQYALQYLVQRTAFGPVSVPGDAPPVPVVPVAESTSK